ncbi:MAG TPA: acyl-CoA thioesterase [Polyangiaceae bacterium]|nr:acyl-CoA thioesterase [Polyangiaceae bacterium]
MNLLLRFLWLRLVTRFRPPCSLLGPCRTPFRVLPTDLDLLRHMNNGIYFSLLDLARLDLSGRSGLAAKMEAAGYYGVVAAETIRFRRSLELFQAFEVESRVIGWDEKVFALRQTFLCKGSEVATAVVWARFLRRSGGGVAPKDMLTIAGYDGPDMPLPEWAQHWSDVERQKMPRDRTRRGEHELA